MTSASTAFAEGAKASPRAAHEDTPAIFPQKLVYRTIFGLASVALAFSSAVTWLQGATSGNLPILLLAILTTLLVWGLLERFNTIPRWLELITFTVLTGVFFGYFSRTVLLVASSSDITTVPLVVRQVDWYIWTPLLYVVTHLLFAQRQALRWCGLFFVLNLLIGLAGFALMRQRGAWQADMLTQLATFVDFQLVSLIFIGLTHYVRRSAEQILAREHDDRRRAHVHYQMMFEHTPVALWEEDLSAVYEELQRLQASGVDLAEHLRSEAELERLFNLIRVRHANQLAQAYWRSLAAPAKEAYTVSDHDRYMWYLGLLSIAQGRHQFRVSDPLSADNYADNYGMRFEPNEVTADVSWQVLESDVPFARVLVSRVDLSHVRRAEAERDEERRLLHTLVNALPDYVFAIDTDTRITLANQAVADVLDCTPQQLTNKRYDEVLPQSVADALTEYDAEVFAGKTLIGKERNFNGRFFLTNCVPLISERGQVTGAVIASRDISELKANEEAVRRSEALLQRAQRLAKIGNWHLDTSTGKLEWSEETFRIFGRKPSEGMPMLEEYYQYLPEEDRSKSRRAIQEAIDHGQPYEVDHTIIRRDGQAVHVHSRRERAEVASDGRVCLYGTIQDISDRKRLESQLSERNSRLEAAVAQAHEANQAREMFVSNITHELRTPLNTISGFSQLLEIEKISQEKMNNPEYVSSLVDGLRRIRNASELLNELVTELVIMASARNNPEGIDIDWEDVPIVTLVREACSMVIPQAREQGVTIHVDVPPVDMRPFVRGDARKLQQIMLNLLTNAIKYNKRSGSVEVRVSCHGNQVQIAVEDSGRGMSVEQRERLFTPFERLGVQGTDIPGRGLGLALAQTYAKAMQTEITVASELGKGSRFALLLQRVAAPD